MKSKQEREREKIEREAREKEREREKEMEKEREKERATGNPFSDPSRSISPNHSAPVTPAARHSVPHTQDISSTPRKSGNPFGDPTPSSAKNPFDLSPLPPTPSPSPSAVPSRVFPAANPFDPQKVSQPLPRPPGNSMTPKNSGVTTKSSNPFDFADEIASTHHSANKGASESKNPFDTKGQGGDDGGIVSLFSSSFVVDGKVANPFSFDAYTNTPTNSHTPSSSSSNRSGMTQSSQMNQVKSTPLPPPPSSSSSSSTSRNPFADAIKDKGAKRRERETEQEKRERDEKERRDRLEREREEREREERERAAAMQREREERERREEEERERREREERERRLSLIVYYWDRRAGMDSFISCTFTISNGYFIWYAAGTTFGEKRHVIKQIHWERLIEVFAITNEDDLGVDWRPNQRDRRAFDCMLVRYREGEGEGGEGSGSGSGSGPGVGAGKGKGVTPSGGGPIVTDCVGTKSRASTLMILSEIRSFIAKAKIESEHRRREEEDRKREEEERRLRELMPTWNKKLSKVNKSHESVRVLQSESVRRKMERKEKEIFAEKVGVSLPLCPPPPPPKRHHVDS